jgi:hypothetical protein
MRSSTRLAMDWLTGLTHNVGTIVVPGVCALFLFDLNFNIFRGEFSLEDITNFNTVVMYYVEKLDISGQQSTLYAVVMAILVYLTGFFLHASSKFFTGPHRFHSLFQVGEFINEPSLEMPGAAKNLLNLGPEAPTDGTSICMSIVEASSIPSKLPALERQCGFYRSMGYLFCLLLLVDIGLFVVAFDFTDLVLKICLVVMNIVFAFLFFKGQSDVIKHWKAQLQAETLVAIHQMKKA